MRRYLEIMLPPALIQGIILHAARASEHDWQWYITLVVCCGCLGILYWQGWKDKP